jgi:alginate O-acetyltransferase complex protein AlgI
MLCYAAQIYADFSGYTDMARGMAMILGFRLPFNFYYPYFALGFGDFWRRWHISLSRWFRDYIYIPLGGSRGSSALLVRNMLLTMFLVGLWHGASWMFVWWGVLHGLFLLLDHFLLRPYLLPRISGSGPVPWLGRTLTRLLTLAAVVMAWVFFRSQSLDQALGITRSMLPFLFDYPPLPSNPLEAVWLMIKVRAAALMTPLDLPWDFWRIIQPAAIILAMHLVALWTWGGRMHRRYPKPVYFLTALAMLLMIFFNRAGTDNAFIYFQF